MNDNYIEEGKKIIENTDQGFYDHGYGYGAHSVVISIHELRELVAGKALASSNGEYVTFITLSDEAKTWAAGFRVAKGVTGADTQVVELTGEWAGLIADGDIENLMRVCGGVKPDDTD